MKKIATRIALVSCFLFAGQLSATAQTVVTDDISTNTTWTANNEYILDGLVFVDAGAILTIEPGTVVKAREDFNISNGDGASALIIRRNATLIAKGEVFSPIIFTSELDDVNDPLDLATTRTAACGGGLILLGNCHDESADDRQPD